MWNKTEPPKQTVKPVTIRFRCRISNSRREAEFVWNDQEDAFVMAATANPHDGVVLLESDYEILGWR